MPSPDFSLLSLPKSFKDLSGIFQKFRDYERTIVLEDGTDIECDRIVEIRGI
mgnify:CR=1 FL=1